MKHIFRALAIVLMLAASSAQVLAAERVTYPAFKAWSTAGAMLSGGRIWTYEPGTTTPKTTYTTAAESQALSNPICLDSLGEKDIFLDGPTKMVLEAPTSGGCSDLNHGTVLWTKEVSAGLSEADVSALIAAAIAASDTVTSVDTVVELSSIVGTDGDIVQPLGYAAAGDGGGGPPRVWVSGAAAGTYVHNYGTILVPGDGSAAWITVTTEPINIRWFGAKGDDTDTAGANTTAIQRWLNYVVANHLSGYAPTGIYRATKLWGKYDATGNPSGPVTPTRFRIYGDGGLTDPATLSAASPLRTVFRLTEGTNAAFDFSSVGNSWQARGILLENFSIVGNTLGPVLDTSGAFKLTIKNVGIQNHHTRGWGWKNQYADQCIAENVLVNGRDTLTVASVDTSTDVITISGEAPGVLADTAVTLSGDDLPAPGMDATLYYVCSPSGSTLKLCTSPGGAAVNFTDSGTGTTTINLAQSINLGESFDMLAVSAALNTITTQRFYGAVADKSNMIAGEIARISTSAGDPPAPLAVLTDYYIVDPRHQVSSVNTTTDTITATSAHNLVADTPVRVSSDDTLPAPLVAGTTYYVGAPAGSDMTLLVSAGGATVDLTTAGAGVITVTLEPTNVQISATPGGAPIDITDAGTGTHTITRQATPATHGDSVGLDVSNNLYRDYSGGKWVYGIDGSLSTYSKVVVIAYQTGWMMGIDKGRALLDYETAGGLSLPIGDYQVANTYTAICSLSCPVGVFLGDRYQSNVFNAPQIRGTIYGMLVGSRASNNTFNGGIIDATGTRVGRAAMKLGASLADTSSLSTSIVETKNNAWNNVRFKVWRNRANPLLINYPAGSSIDDNVFTDCFFGPNSSAYTVEAAVALPGSSNGQYVTTKFIRPIFDEDNTVVKFRHITTANYEIEPESRKKWHSTIETTDDTTANLKIVTIPDGEIQDWTVKIIAIDEDGENKAVYERAASLTAAGGVAAFVGGSSVVNVRDAEDTAAMGATITVSGDTARVRVTGPPAVVPAETTFWEAWIDAVVK